MTLETLQFYSFVIFLIEFYWFVPIYRTSGRCKIFMLIEFTKIKKTNKENIVYIIGLTNAKGFFLKRLVVLRLARSDSSALLY